ncbi:MAG: hypothetical protein HQL56_01450 [Magnetococcales bacterium]|nr:hypothetical protein [Magnetococcales bacterium]
MIPAAGLHIDQAPPLHIPFRFFFTAPLFLMLAAGALIVWNGELFQERWSPQTIAVTHLVVLGWITMIMCGALYQMLPVLAGLPVRHPALAPWVHASLSLGILTLVLEIGIGLHRWLLLAASFFLAAALTLFIGQIARTLAAAPARHPTINAMALALTALAVVLILGLTFLGEYAHGFLGFDRPAMLGLHVAWALFGWVGLLIIGVSFQVLPMFYMMPLFPVVPARWILGGLFLSLVGVTPLLLLRPESHGLLLLAMIPGYAAVAGYALVLKQSAAKRKRRIVDASWVLWIFGLSCAGLATLLPPLWFVLESETLRLLFGVLYLLGGVVSITLAMLFKIVPFLVWFHRFSRLAGLVQIPMMEDLYPEPLAKWGVGLHLAGTVSLLGGLAGYAILVQLGGILMGGVAILLVFGILSALRHPVPEAPPTADFASFFKDLPPPPP